MSADSPAAATMPTTTPAPSPYDTAYDAPYKVASPPTGTSAPDEVAQKYNDNAYVPQKYPDAPAGYPLYGMPLPVDWDDLDSISFDCLCCPCTYRAALMGVLVYAIVLLSVFEITPMALYKYGWLYWDRVLVAGQTITFNGVVYYSSVFASAPMEMKAGWYKGTSNLGPQAWEYRKIEDVYGFNGTTADATQGLGETCGSLAVVGTFFCLIYIAIIFAMFKPRENHKMLRSCNRRFVPAFACFLGLLQFTFAFAFFGKAAVDWSNYLDQVAGLVNVQPSSSSTTLWPHYAWFFFLFGSITWPLLGFSMASFPIPGDQEVARGSAAV